MKALKVVKGAACAAAVFVGGILLADIAILVWDIATDGMSLKDVISELEDMCCAE